ncbi:glutamine synthetase family protein [Mangrovicoccus algicola]|uniref:Glutamine synthetase n=1 Tax=Mangrovicoccus algicola TaxID=2771008 RepID=A0A8J6YVG9_9RHOB|nr:glutamine synthetase family protein [Mangrovicoccus algicola]MBE3636934.1 glutamine synthetase [Mangrovicoccus algicola]
MEVETTALRVACADLNGQMRGKRLPGSAAARIEFQGLRMPLSTLSLDVLGHAAETGPADGDGQMRVTERGPVPMPWLVQPSTLIPMWMFADDGRPAPTCPRHALAAVIARWHRRGWKPRAAPAIEVMLVDDTGAALAPALAPDSGRPLRASQAGSVAQLDAFAAFFDDIYDGAEAMGIALDDTVSGAGLAQFRIALAPAPAMRAADDLWLLKALIRGTARAHDMAACFLAKPFEDQPGNGLHVGYWAEGPGGNVFDNGLLAGSGVMRQAVAGGLSCLPGATLLFAPHETSYARFVPGSLAPTSASWGYENRSCALRIPAGDPAERRIEHRAAGADANPYLVMAAILGGGIAGIEDDLAPPEPVIGSAYDQRVLQFPMDWDAAIERFSGSPRMARIFPAPLIETMSAVKRQEQHQLARFSAAETVMILMDAV